MKQLLKPQNFAFVVFWSGLDVPYDAFARSQRYIDKQGFNIRCGFVLIALERLQIFGEQT